jgi:hypothetical protein
LYDTPQLGWDSYFLGTVQSAASKKITCFVHLYILAEYSNMSSSARLNTPVVLIIFRRPETTQKVFETIRQAQPRQLLVIADGPNPDRPGEAEQCAQARAIIDRVDWDCEVIKRYSDINLGCARSVSSGLSWAFSLVEEAIILEDDCLPHPSFFPFCAELLARYRHDSRVTSISGQNVQFGRRRTEYDYYFSAFNHIWGWATWRRAWQNFDFEIKRWPEFRDQGLLNHLWHDRVAVRYWTKIFNLQFSDPVIQQKNWDYQWTFSCWCQSGLGIISNVNLVSNLGFDGSGTNIVSSQGEFAARYGQIHTQGLEFPLQHPPFVLRNLAADQFTQKTLFHKSRLQQLKEVIKSQIKPLSRPVKPNPSPAR